MARPPGAGVKISVALCTYNGARYLQEQLDSIQSQSRLPDEVVICDDASQDDTRQLLDAFAQRAPFPVRLYFNEVNLGYTKNFEQAIGYCSGDVIVLCDQDDVWHPDKLQCIETAMGQDADAGLIFTDADIIDGDSQPLDYRLWQCADFSEQRLHLFSEGRAVEALINQNAVTGATMAFRSRFRDLVLPIPIGGPLIHDWWIALISTWASAPTAPACSRRSTTNRLRASWRRWRYGYNRRSI
jgi:glycosyltransferase involved in cell wall biosynthesis